MAAPNPTIARMVGGSEAVAEGMGAMLYLRSVGLYLTKVPLSCNEPFTDGLSGGASQVSTSSSRQIKADVRR
jgi:hypothetical protein